MRLFLGIELPRDIKTAVGERLRDCRRRIERAAPRASVRWVEPDNLHVTLWFLGEVSEDAADRLRAVLLEPFPVPPFTTELSGFGTYPPKGSPRVIWMGIGEGRERLTDVHQELARRLPPLGFEPERRAYSPHLTLGRVKDVRSADAAAVRSALAGRRPPVHTFEVRSVMLFRSRLSPTGSRYESLLRVPLK